MLFLGAFVLALITIFAYYLLVMFIFDQVEVWYKKRKHRKYADKHFEQIERFRRGIF